MFYHRMFSKALQGIIAIILVATLQLRSVPTAHAFDEEACTATYLQEKWVALDCAPGFATDRDRILVFVRDGVNSARPWQENLSYTNAVWIFEAGAAGKASLIIDFHTDRGELVANLYDDYDGDGMVKYTIKGGEPVVAEAALGTSSRWTMRVVAKDGWWQRDGMVSFNLDIFVDGQVWAVYNYQFQGFDKLFKKDGIVDMAIHVRDPNHNGRPDYDWRQAYPLIPDSWGVDRTTIMVNTEDDEHPMGEHVFWPYISPNPHDFLKDYNYSFPPISVDWNKGKVVGVSEFVTSRFNPGNYFIYSIERIREGQLTGANFENPFAFYDLAQAKDGYPDLAIRNEYWLPNDRYYEPGRFPYPVSAVEYTWDQNHDHSWDYGVTLFGKNGIDAVVQFPEFSVKTIPYQEYPYWVTERTWEAAGLIAVEKSPYWTSEHIYAQAFFGSRAFTHEYFPGRSDKPPEEYWQTTEPGFRAEYNFHYSEKPYLYFSPVDRKLHLLRATRGVWVFVDGVKEIRYENLGGQYLNKWSYLEGGVLKKSLYYASGHLILTDGQVVEIKKIAEPPSLFQTSPPRNSQEWQRLGQQLEQYKGNFAPGDFEGMFAQFQGESISVSGGGVRDFRLTEDGGFRFVLDLQPGFTASATEDGLWGALTQPQTYLVAYEEGKGFLIRTALPAKIELGDNLPTVVVQPIGLEPIPLKVVARNRGDEDAEDIIFRFYVADRSEKETLIGEVKTTLQAGEEKILSAPWIAPGGGRWMVSVRLKKEDGVITDMKTGIVDVLAGPSGELKLLSWEWEGPFGVGLLLLVLCGLAASAFGLASGSMERQSGEARRAQPVEEDERGHS